MKSFNLSEWALKHRSLALYFLLALLVSGFLSYFQLSQKEDPDFTFKVMTVSVQWPGATAREIEQQVTDKIERKLQETPWLDNVSSYSKAGESVIFVTLKDSMPPSELKNAWASVRKRLSDLKGALPEDVIGPSINDEFGDTFGSIYALTSDTLSNADLAHEASLARQELLKLKNVSKVDLVGIQDEKIYIEFSSSQIAKTGIDPMKIASILKAQNAMEPAGEVDTHYDITRLRVSGDFNSLESIKDIGIRAGGKTYRLGDICTVSRGYADPATFKMRFMGQDAIGIAVSMTPDGNAINLGRELKEAIEKIKANLPKGTQIRQVSDQPQVVKKSIGDFMRSLLEALFIVLAVSFVSLGTRAGMVVALSIPIVLAGVFLLMNAFGIDLQRVSLGALIISLGLLVDDAMIAVEMMNVKLEQGWSKMKAATFAYQSTAFPMLAGTLITAAAFLPVGLAKSSAGEYTFSICAVVTIALLVSWFVAVIFTPLIGHALLKEHRGLHKPLYTKGFYEKFRRLVVFCVQYKKSVILATIVLFALSVAGFNKVEQQFFPPSERPELLMDIWLPEGTTFSTTESITRAVEKKLQEDADIIHYTSYIGGSTPRFYLPLDLQLPSINYAQIVIMTKDITARENVLKRIRKIIDEEYPDFGLRVSRLENGPPVGYPIQFRITGENLDKLKTIAREVLSVVKKNKNTKNVSLDSNEKTGIINIDLNQEKARELGVNSQSLSRYLQALLSGITVSHYREGEKSIEIVARAGESERGNPESLNKINIYTENGQFVPLSSIAKITEADEDGIIWRLNRFPVITVRADIPDTIQALDVSEQINTDLSAIRARLPKGYSIEVGGAMEDSEKAQDSIKAILPFISLLIVTLLMLQLKRINLVLLVLMTAPLGIIGVTASLLSFHVPFGFVAMLGMISLAGMIMRNSVILVDQIEQDMASGLSRYDAIIDSTVRRARPILLTALAAILAMIPLMGSVFWGPMAAVIMGGLLVATLLTLLYLPALYAFWFRVP